MRVYEGGITCSKARTMTSRSILYCVLIGCVLSVTYRTMKILCILEYRKPESNLEGLKNLSMTGKPPMVSETEITKLSIC